MVEGDVVVFVWGRVWTKGWVEKGCADGCIEWWSFLGLRVLGIATAWVGMIVAQNMVIGIRQMRKTRFGAGCMSWRLSYHLPLQASMASFKT